MKLAADLKQENHDLRNQLGASEMRKEVLRLENQKLRAALQEAANCLWKCGYNRGSSPMMDRIDEALIKVSA